MYLQESCQREDVVYVNRLRARQTHILGLLGAVEAGVSVNAEPWQGFCLGVSDAGDELWSKAALEGGFISLIGSSARKPGPGSACEPAK